jgi:hypothetical protein
VSPHPDAVRWQQGADTEESAAGLIELLADWTWEQDPEFRFISVSSMPSANAADANGFDPVAFFAHPH